MRSIRTPFSRPFPALEHPWQRLLMAVSFGLFVFLFLYTFRPFGLASLQHPAFGLICAGYAAITSIAIIICNLILPGVLPSFYRENTWTLGRELMHTLLAITLVTLGNVYYSAFLNFFEVSLTSALLFLFFTLAIAVFPVTASLLLRLYRLEKRHNQQSGIANAQLKKDAVEDQLVYLKDENNTDVLEVNLAGLLYFRNADNYVEVVTDHMGTPETNLLRVSLKSLDEQLEEANCFFRCHRSYLVNLNRVAEVSGNARGLQLSLPPDERKVPVSRSRIASFLDRMDSH